MGRKLLWPAFLGCRVVSKASIAQCSVAGFVRRAATRMHMMLVVNGTVGMIVRVGMHGFAMCWLARAPRHRRYPLYRRYRNNGAPKNEVMAPMGRMMGDITNRAAKSESSMMAEPRTSEAGNKNR